jgi:hypothetical protein
MLRWLPLLFLGIAAAQQAPLRVVTVGPRIQIITPAMLPPGPDESDSINGPSLIRVPAWVQSPLGKYYLYFAHHTGKYIRMAYADRVEGPWKMRPGGVLHLDRQKVVSNHIASPDAVIDEARRQIVLFYHGPIRKGGQKQGQRSAAAVSRDGLDFEPLNQMVGPAYLRVFSHGGRWYGLVGSGEMIETTDLDAPFRPVADIIGDEIAASLYPTDIGGARKAASGRERFSIRHIGVDVAGNRLVVYFSCVGHMPERILATVVDLAAPPYTWRAQGTLEVLRPQLEWEGAKLAEAHSLGGKSRQLENSLRDPAVFRDEGKTWLLYSAAGEHGIGMVRIEYREAR